MLNPSTADESQDDPTIRKCAAFSARWGFSRMVVVNLFAFRSTDPRIVTANPEASIGPDNDGHIIREASAADEVICAWGAHGTTARRSERVRAILQKAGVEPKALSVCKNGEPGHPLYIPYSAERAGY